MPGEPVLAVADGQFIAFDPAFCQIGAKLILDGHQGTVSVIYCDLGRVDVRPGDRMRRGGQIGIIGRRGFVHVAVKLNGRAVDPFTFLPLQ